MRARTPSVMARAKADDLALVPHGDQDLQLAPYEGCTEPIAEHNFNRKKMFSLEQGINKLQKTARQQHEVVSQIETGMKSMISETDLRRAIGLAFQEFEQRLEDAFQESNRKCLGMFSKRDDVTELENLLSKKVNWAEYNAVLKKIADLRMYLDTMAEDIFIGHREALNGEFFKKADKTTVEEALKLKADWAEVNEVRARLERLEVLVSHTDARQTAALEALRKESIANREELAKQHRALISANEASIAALRTEHSAAVDRLAGAEGEIKALTRAAEKLREVQQALSKKHSEVIMPTIASMQEQLGMVEAAAERMRQGLQVLADDCKGFQQGATQKFTDLFAQAQHSKTQLEFLMEATEMIKRRSRETSKSTDARFKDGSHDQERLAQQVAALERQLRRHEREVRQLERLASRAEAGTATLLPLPAPELAPPADPNDRLRSMLDQLEKIAGSGPPHEQLGIEWNPKRPPLPFGGSDGVRRGSDADFAKLQLPGVDREDIAAIDSARALPMASAIRTGHGSSSPRPAGQATSRTPRKKR
mmetsp:Transcript_90409/g.286499  ORF Transcript_90409/g.286499 Transcript_90409/m.286499 type:complete len:538 (-) Transcript_90409:41-1654(-)